MSKSKQQSKQKTTSKSEKSGSDFTRATRKYLLSRLFKNNKVEIRLLLEEDLKWLWASYKKGGFSDIIKDGLDRDAFVSQMTTIFSMLSTSYGILDDGRMIGVVPILNKRFDSEMYQELDISWFPWATPRQKIIGAAKAIIELKKKAPILVYVKGKHNKFVTHIAKYGIMRRVGKLRQKDGDLYLFESIQGA